MKKYIVEEHSKAPEPGVAGEQFVFRAMSYNIHSGINANREVNLQNTLNIIGDSDADIVALQEVDTEKTVGKNCNQARSLAESLDMDYVFFPVESNGLHAFGLAILSRFSFNQYYCDWLPNLCPKLNPRKRGAIQATLQTPVGPISFFNTHLSLYKPERGKQLKVLLDNNWLLSVPKNEPVIFCGDLNAGALSKTYRRLKKYLIDVQKTLDDPLLPKRTFHSKAPLIRIDHMFISNHFTPLKVEVKINKNTQMASDHLPLIAELEMKKIYRL
ncbi:MAG: endonuclease/exonuclease/phosphatase family protein [Thermodesulfobacteriota bacterium]|nr:endonuclease/exonuclease/phosphatase family protein [Thermodesulfobacteriota bacterium]